MLTGNLRKNIPDDPEWPLPHVSAGDARRMANGGGLFSRIYCPDERVGAHRAIHSEHLRRRDLLRQPAGPAAPASSAGPAPEPNRVITVSSPWDGAADFVGIYLAARRYHAGYPVLSVSDAALFGQHCAPDDVPRLTRMPAPLGSVIFVPDGALSPEQRDQLLDAISGADCCGGPSSALIIISVGRGHDVLSVRSRMTFPFPRYRTTELDIDDWTHFRRAAFNPDRSDGDPIPPGRGDDWGGALNYYAHAAGSARPVRLDPEFLRAAAMLTP